MIISSKKVQSTLVLEYVGGKDEKGKDIIKKQSFNKISLSATNEKLFQVCKSLEILIGKPIIKIYKADSNVIESSNN